jgi:hypothetical protein
MGFLCLKANTTAHISLTPRFGADPPVAISLPRSQMCGFRVHQACRLLPSVIEFTNCFMYIDDYMKGIV